MKTPTTTILLATLSLVCGSVHATQPTDEPIQASENTDQTPAHASSDLGFSFEASVTGTFASDSDFDSDIGEFSFAKYEAGIKASRRIGDSGMFSLEFDAGLIDYDISPSLTSVAGDAANIGAEFDDVTTLSLIGMYANQTSGGDRWFIGGGVLSNGENGADFSDTLDGMLMGGYLHTVNSKLKMGLGVAVRSRLDDGVLVVPLPQIQYTINEFWSIHSEGVGAKINYKASDDLNYGISGHFESTTFRLDDSHALATEGMVTHRSFPVAFYAQYEPNDTIEISGRVGGMLAGELEILNTAGNNIAVQDIDTGIFGSLSISFKF